LRALRILGPFALLCGAAGEPAPQWVRHVIVENFHSFTAVAADFSGTGRIDVIANGGPRKEDVLFTAPDWKPRVLHSGDEGIHSAVLDMDGDGRPDYVCARYSPGMIYWLRNGDWSFHLLDEAAKGGLDGVHGLLAADVNRDGKLDLIANSGGPAGGFPNSLAWFSAPGFERHIVANGDAPGTTHYVSLGDLNGDGRPDIATAAKLGNWFGWFEAPADPKGVWRKHILAENQNGATNVLIADWNLDGKPDVIAARGHGKGLVWYEAPHWIPHEFGSDLEGPHSLGIADLNRDGKPDLVTCGKDSKVVVWFENDGKGNVTPHQIDSNQAGYDIRLLDMNRDGRIDILLAGQDSNNVVWYENGIAAKR
jgi:hypothetical protein